MTADMMGEMYGYNRKGYAEPCAEKIPFDHDLYNPAEATISNTYFATGDAWAADDASTASINNETGDVTVHIAAPKSAQWQSQVFILPGFEYELGATYQAEFKIFTTNQLGGVVVKINDADEGWYFSYPNDNIFLANQTTRFETTEYVVGPRGEKRYGELILSFGWVPENTDIVISDIRISKTKDAPESALEDVETSGAQKIFRDGQVIILRDGHEYTVQGQLIK